MTQQVLETLTEEYERHCKLIEFYATNEMLDISYKAIKMEKRKYAFMSVVSAFKKAGIITKDEYTALTDPMKLFYNACVEVANKQV